MTLARYAQDAGVHRYIDIIGLNAGDVGAQYKAVFFLDDINGRDPVGDGLLSLLARHAGRQASRSRCRRSTKVQGSKRAIFMSFLQSKRSFMEA